MGSTRTFYYTAFLLTFLTAGTTVLAQGRPALAIAYISEQRILTEANSAKAAAKELEALRAAKAQDLNAKKQALEATKLQIVNAGGLFSASKRQELTELGKRQEAELQQATQQAQSDYTELQKKVQDRLRTEVFAIVSALAAERGVQYVLNQDLAVILAPPGANWTAEVLERLNGAAAQRSGSEKATADKVPKKP